MLIESLTGPRGRITGGNAVDWTARWLVSKYRQPAMVKSTYPIAFATEILVDKAMLLVIYYYEFIFLNLIRAYIYSTKEINKESDESVNAGRSETCHISESLRCSRDERPEIYVASVSNKRAVSAATPNRV